MTAQTDTRDLIQKIYIGYYGRAGDPTGLEYWAGRSAAGMSSAAIADSFSVQAESTAMYSYLAAPSLGFGQDTFLNSVYLNLFERSIDSEGATYWAGQLNAGRDVGGIILDIINGAQGTDITTVANKLEVANYYTEQVMANNTTWTSADDAADATSVIASVTSVYATVTSAKASVLTLIAADAVVEGRTFTLTTGANTGTLFTGNSAADFFDGSLNAGNQTLGTADNLNGGAGIDTLTATILGGTVRPTLTAIENIEVTGTTATNTVDLSSATGYTALKSLSSTAAGLVTFNQISAATVAGTVQSSAGATFSFTDAALAGTNSFALNLDNASGTVTITDQGGSNALETVAITSSGSSTSLTQLVTGASSGTGVGTTQVTVAGSANIHLGTTALATQVLTVDAAAATGNVTVITGASTAGQTVTGGSGADSITLAGTAIDVINGGAGNDTIVVNAVLFTAADAVAGGADTDNLVISSLAAATDLTIADSLFTLVTGVERLSGGTLAQGNTTTSDISVTATTFAKAAGIVRFSDAASGDAAYSLTLGSAYNATAVTYDFSDVADTADFTATAAGTTAVMTFQGDADGLTANDVLTGGTSAGDTLIFNAAGATGTIANAGLNGIENITVTATNGAVTLTSNDTQITDASTTALVINAAAASGNSTFTLSAITHAMTYTGSGFIDSVTSGSGNDNITLGGGNDVYTLATTNLTSADTIDGGADNDTLAISDAATVIDSDHTRVTNVEQLTLAAATNSVTLDVLANASGLTRVNGNSGVDTVAIGAGFVNAIRVNFSTGAGDSVIVTGVAALTAVTTETGLTADDVVTGGTTANDVLLLTADGGTGNFTGVSAIETYRVSGDAGAVGIALVEANIASGSTLTIDAASMVGGANALTVDASADSDGKINVTAGSAADSITLTATGADTVSGGADIDTIIVTSAGFTSADNIAGGDGNDVITMSNSATVVDADFTNVTSVMSLTSTATGSANTLTATLGALALAAGVTSVIGGTGIDTVTVGAGYTGAVRVTTTSGSDVVSASASAGTLVIQTNADNIDAGDIWTGGTGAADELRISGGTSIASSLAGVTLFEKITVSANAAVTITLADVNIASGVNMVVNGAALITTNALTLNASNETNGTVSVTGGAGADVITGGALNDTIVGDAGNDVIDGGAGDDSVSAGAGTDTVTIGSAGDIADGGSGTDTLTVSSIGGSAFVIDLSATGDQLTTYNGSANAGLQQGFETADLSTVTGVVTGTAAAGGSTITGGSGNDSLSGGAGNDSLTGNAGADTLISGGGIDVLTGGDGGDRYETTLSSVGIVDDTVTEAGTGGTDVLLVRGAAPSTTARAALDLTAAGMGGSLIETLDITSLTVFGAIVTTGVNNTTVLGSDFSDSITGSDGTDSLLGSSGSDIINAGNGADTLEGGSGDDFLKADSTGETDVDSVVGGTGNDTMVIADAGEADNFVEAANGGTNDTLFVNGVDASAALVNGAADFTGATGLGIEQIVISTAGTATFIGAQLTGNIINITEAGGGASTLTVTATATGTTNLSSLTFSAGSYVDSTGTIVAGNAMTSATDTIIINGANGSAETIVGTSIADLIFGGTGTFVDNITGGAGADQFRFGTTSITQVITDFTDGTDFIAFRDGGGGLPAIQFANQTGTAAGIVLAVGNLGAVTNTAGAGFASNSVNVSGVAMTGAEIIAIDDVDSTLGGDLTYLVVFNSTTGKGEIWYDADWDAAGDTLKVATLDNITTVGGITALTEADFYLFA